MVTIGCVNFISKPYPRKGRETAGYDPQTKTKLQFQNHIPARGRKQRDMTRKPKRNYNFKTISPQGDGNNQLSAKAEKTTLFQNHIPARGRKQVIWIILIKSNAFQNHIPARGRKHVSGNKCKILVRRFQNHIPARGRKHDLAIHKSPFLNNFKTISPQGDGNNPRACILRIGLLISKPYPRKGTETL